jgi:glucose-6-phosphate isomerase
MINLQFQYKHVKRFLSEEEIHLMQDEVDISHSLLVEKAGKGNQYLGWIDLPAKTDELLIGNIEAVAKALREKIEILVVIGIGGSYLGSKAIIEALSSPFSAFTGSHKRPVVVYAGNNISQDYHAELLHLLDSKEYALVVISKSGTTTEPAIAFRLLKNHIEKKYGTEEAASRIIAITDSSKGALKSLSEKNGYKTYVIPDDVGGRYSVLSPVGMLPVAVAGFNIRELIEGATEMRKACIETSSIFFKEGSC